LHRTGFSRWRDRFAAKVCCCDLAPQVMTPILTLAKNKH